MKRASNVAVIGASASGLFTALLLARSGLDVEVFERTDQLDPEPRTLITTGRLRRYLGDLADASIVNEIHRFDLFADGQVASVDLIEPDLIVERSALIRALAKQAEDDGVSITTDSRFEGLRPGVDGIGVRLTGRSEPIFRRVDAVVGADGVNSKVAQAASWPRRPTVPLVQAIVRIPTDMDFHSSRVWFCPEDTPYFYWLIPHSESHGALGVIGEGGAEIRTRLQAFLDDRGFKAIEFQAARIPLYTDWQPFKRRLGGGDVYLVGDAAGQVKVSTVGGLVTGFRGAYAVADSILGRKSSKEERSLRVELEMHRLIRKTIHDFTQEDWVKLFKLLNDPVVRSLSSTSRDEAARALFGMLRFQPRFLVYALRAMLERGSFPRP